MARFRLDLEYVGTRYSGWQAQKNARTVQGALHEAVARVSGRNDYASYGSGRTDAGVHALHQVAHLDLETRLAPEALRFALNDELPADIHLLRVAKATRDFHARRSAVGRSYLYQVCRRRTAFGKPFVWWIKDPLDAAAMAETGRLFEGMHDFRSYADADPEERSTRVKVGRVEVAEAGPLVLVRVLGSHFLWKMVRRMVGVMAEVGRGGLRPADAERFLREASPVPAGLTAPPSGLFLERVLYEGDPPPGELLPVILLRGAPGGRDAPPVGKAGSLSQAPSAPRSEPRGKPAPPADAPPVGKAGSLSDGPARPAIKAPMKASPARDSRFKT